MKTYAIHTGHTTANGSNISNEVCQTLNRDSAPAIVHLPDGPGGGVMTVENDMTGTLRRETHGHEPVVAFAQNQLGELRIGEVTNTLNQNSNASGRNTPMVKTPFAVRRLTPTECERLQGFPDGHTAITYKGKPAPDGARYKALGNSMAVNCMVFLGLRIQMVDEILKEQREKIQPSC